MIAQKNYSYSVIEYLLIDQYNYQVDHYVKVGQKKWTLEEHNSLEDQVTFSCVAIAITLKDIYNKVKIDIIE